MISSDVTEFSDLLRALGTVHGKKTEPMSQSYFEALKDIPMGLIRAAKDHLLANARFWPKPVDWRAAVQKVEAKTPTPMPPQRFITHPDGTEEELYICLTCEDTGWAPECGCPVGVQDMRGHCPTHGGYSANGIVYRQRVKPCVCRATNERFQFNHQARRVEPERVRTDG